MKTNKQYWQDRFIAVEHMRNRQAKNVVDSVTPAFDSAMREIEKEITAWYNRYSLNNQISLAEAKRQLSARELKEFQWDVDTFIKYGRDNAIDPKWMKQLENASARYHISRLEALKIRTQQAAEVAFGNELDELDQFLPQMYTEAYYHTAYEIQKGLGIAWDIGQIDNSRLIKILKKPWTVDGYTFSNRIWKGKQQLIDAVSKEMTQMCILGGKPDKAIANLAHKMQVSKSQAGRLIMTESAYFGSKAQKDCFNDLDVEKYEIVATLDLHTSEICQAMDGKVFKMSDFEPGVTAPPFHPWCRTITCPWFDDEFTADETRAAKDLDTGETFQIPANMKYPDWADCFVNYTKKPEDFLKPATKSDIVKAGKEVENVRKAIQLDPSMYPPSFTAKKPEAKNTQLFMDFINSREDANPDTIELYSKMSKMENIESKGIPWTVKHTKNSAVNYRYYTHNGRIAEASISYPKLTGDDFTGQAATTLHEQMHLMDMYNRSDPNRYDGWYSASDDAFMKIFTDIKSPDDVKMSDEVQQLFADFDVQYHDIHDRLWRKRNAEYNRLHDEFWAKPFPRNHADVTAYNKAIKALEKEYTEGLDYERRNALGGGVTCFEDIYDALSGGHFRDNGVVHYGHGGSYYRSMENRCEETIANYGALSVLRPDLIELLRKDYPDMVDALERIVKEMSEKAGG